jgi:hypothetical protein
LATLVELAGEECFLRFQEYPPDPRDTSRIGSFQRAAGRKKLM